MHPKKIIYSSSYYHLTKSITGFWLIMGAVLILLAGCAGPSNYKTPTNTKTRSQQPISIDASKRNEVVLTALSLLNTRYRYGGASTDAGFDCSGLVAYVVQTATDASLPHNAAAIAKLSRPITKDELNMGDLVFFNTTHRPYSHVGIYLSDGNFINAPSSGGRVRIDKLSNTYFAKRFEGARTLFTQ